jgi:hypothetical protein
MRQRCQGAGTLAVRALYGAGALIIVNLIARFFARRIRAARALRALVRKAHSATQQHLMPLVRRRAQLVQLDAYGKPKNGIAPLAGGTMIDGLVLAVGIAKLSNSLDRGRISRLSPLFESPEESAGPTTSDVISSRSMRCASLAGGYGRARRDAVQAPSRQISRTPIQGTHPGRRDAAQSLPACRRKSGLELRFRP